MRITMQKYGRAFERTADGGWLEQGAELPKGSTARICGESVVIKEAAQIMYNGTFHGGTFLGGTFLGGTFWNGEFWNGEFDGGTFLGGTFWNGEFHGGKFHGGKFHGGTFLGGTFWNGEFWNGEFRNGEFRGGTFHCSPSCAQRSDGHMFVAKYVDDDLRIWAGCRNFSWDKAVAHWGNPEHPHHVESMRIIEFLKAQEDSREEI